MELHWLPVEQRIIFKINLICFKILNNLAPDYLVDLIHVYEPARYLRSSSDKWRLVIKPYNLKTYGFFSINNEYEYENDFKPYSYSKSFSQLSM